MTLAPGQTAPDFTLANQDGEEVTLSSFAGKSAVVVYFYPRDNTPGCTTEAIDFTTAKADFAAAGVTILGISPDSVKSHKNFCTKKDLGITLLSDPEKAAATPFGAWGEKKNYGRTYMGIIRSTFLIGKDGKLVEAWRNVRVKNHVAKVLAAAQKLAQG